MALELDAIRAANRLEDVVHVYAPLRPHGQTLKARCPFHDDKTPSFVVSVDKQQWYCFSCAEGGDVFRFIEKIEGVPFVESARWLARRAGIETETPTPPSALDLAQARYVDALMSRVGLDARMFLVDRHIASGVTGAFGLGFCERGEFAGRLTIPIRDLRGRIVAHAARGLRDEKPKYLNSSAAVGYAKGQTLYNADKARGPAAAAGCVVLVEGYFDVMRLWSLGITHVVASCGTAVTEGQAALLKRLASTVIVAFDGDAAGQAATLKAGQVLLGAGLDVMVVQLPNGDDPDTVALRDPDGTKRVFTQTQYRSLALFAAETLPVSTLRDRRDYAERVPTLIAHTSWVHRGEAVRAAAARLGVRPEDVPVPRLDASRKAKPTKTGTGASVAEAWLQHYLAVRFAETQQALRAVDVEVLQQVPTGALLMAARDATDEAVFRAQHVLQAGSVGASTPAECVQALVRMVRRRAEAIRMDESIEAWLTRLEHERGHHE